MDIVNWKLYKYGDRYSCVMRWLRYHNLFHDVQYNLFNTWKETFLDVVDYISQRIFVDVNDVEGKEYLQVTWFTEDKDLSCVAVLTTGWRVTNVCDVRTELTGSNWNKEIKSTIVDIAKANFEIEDQTKIFNSIEEATEKYPVREWYAPYNIEHNNIFFSPLMCKSIWKNAINNNDHDWKLKALACYNEAIYWLEQEAFDVKRTKNVTTWDSVLWEINKDSVLLTTMWLFWWSLVYTWYQIIDTIKTFNTADKAKDVITWMKALASWSLIWLWAMTLETLLESAAVDIFHEDYWCDVIFGWWYRWTYCSQYFWDLDELWWPKFVQPMFLTNVVNRSYTKRDMVSLTFLRLTTVDLSIWWALQVYDKVNDVKKVSIAEKVIDSADDLKDTTKLSEKTERALEKTKIANEASVYKPYWTDVVEKTVEGARKSTESILDLSKLVESELLEVQRFWSKIEDVDRKLVISFLNGWNTLELWRKLSNIKYNPAKSSNTGKLINNFYDSLWRSSKEFKELNEYHSNMKRLAHADMIVNDIRNGAWKLDIRMSKYNPEIHHLIPESFVNWNKITQNQKDFINRLTEEFCTKWTWKYCIDWKFDINMAKNAFVLPKWYHGSNLKEYEDKIVERITWVIDESLRKWLNVEIEVLEELKNIRKDIAEWTLLINNAQNIEYQRFALETVDFYK